MKAILLLINNRFVSASAQPGVVEGHIRVNRTKTAAQTIKCRLFPASRGSERNGLYFTPSISLIDGF